MRRGYMLGLLAETEISDTAVNFVATLSLILSGGIFKPVPAFTETASSTSSMNLSQSAWASLPAHVHEETQGFWTCAEKANSRNAGDACAPVRDERRDRRVLRNGLYRPVAARTDPAAIAAAYPPCHDVQRVFRVSTGGRRQPFICAGISCLPPAARCSEIWRISCTIQKAGRMRKERCTLSSRQPRRVWWAASAP